MPEPAPRYKPVQGKTYTLFGSAAGTEQYYAGGNDPKNRESLW